MSFLGVERLQGATLGPWVSFAAACVGPFCPSERGHAEVYGLCFGATSLCSIRTHVLTSCRASFKTTEANSQKKKVDADDMRYISIYTSSSRASRGRKFQKKKELYSKERICL